MDDGSGGGSANQFVMRTRAPTINRRGTDEWFPYSPVSDRFARSLSKFRNRPRIHISRSVERGAERACRRRKFLGIEQLVRSEPVHGRVAKARLLPNIEVPASPAVLSEILKQAGDGVPRRRGVPLLRCSYPLPLRKFAPLIGPRILRWFSADNPAVSVERYPYVIDCVFFYVGSFRTAPPASR